jgi:hypothetical protein
MMPLSCACLIAPKKRLHSCYPWHTGGAYKELMAPGDEVLMAAVNDFNQFDVRVGV